MGVSGISGARISYNHGCELGYDALIGTIDLKRSVALGGGGWNTWAEEPCTAPLPFVCQGENAQGQGQDASGIRGYEQMEVEVKVDPGVG